MHTKRVKIDGVEYNIHHNGDWSSEAIARWTDAARQGHEVRLPAKLLVACGRNAMLDIAIATLEELYEGP